MGGGSSGGCCGNCSTSGSTNPSNKPQPPRTGGKYTIKPRAPAYGPPLKNMGCACSANRDCDGGTYKWDGGGGCGPTAGRTANCTNGLPFADMCPAIGTVTQTDWSGQQVICKYNTVTIPFDQLAGYFDDTNANMIKADRCNPLGYAALAASSECRTYYGTANLNSELLKRVEATGNGWAGDAPQRDFVQQLVADEVIQGRAATDTSSRAKALIRDFCTANPNDPKCGCYNAINKGLSGCQATPTAPGCAELAALGTQFDNAPPEFRPIFQSMKNGVNAMCMSENCKTVRGSTTNAAGILLPGTVPGGDCASNYNVCLTKLTVGQMTGGNIDASCKQTFNLPSPAPAAAPGGTPAPGGTSITSGGPSGTQGGAAGGGGPASSTTPGGNPAAPGASDLLFKDPTGYLDSKNKQMGAIVGAVVFILLILLLLMGGDSGGDNSSAQMQQMIQMRLMGL